MPALLVVLVASLVMGVPPSAHGQEQTSLQDLDGLQDVQGLLRNAVTTLAAQGDTLWTGPHLQRTTDHGESWQTAGAPELERDAGNRLLSLTLSQDTLVGGLTAAQDAAAAGFLVSSDRGATLSFRSPHLDAGTEDVLSYGDNELNALPVTDPLESPPYDVSLGTRPDELWTAGGMSGLRRSADFGDTWERTVLPPDHLERISPDEVYDFEIRPRGGQRGHANHEAYSVLVDETGTVWAGTSAGANRSTPADVFPEFDGERAWDRIGAAEAPDGLTGELVVAIAEQQLPGTRNPIWMATWSAGIGEQLGVTVTRDGGETFEHHLIGERARDFAFQGNVAFVATDNGLFRLDASGEIERHITEFSTPEQPHYEAPPSVSVLAVAVTPGALWAGTEEGLFRSFDEGRTWRVFRAEVPTQPTEPTDDIPQVDTYAYPNPFAPMRNTLRFVTEVEAPQDITIQVYDYAMNLVRTVSGNCPSAGHCEVSWEGRDASGRSLANGVYFYTLNADQQTYRGKLVVIK